MDDRFAFAATVGVPEQHCDKAGRDPCEFKFWIQIRSLHGQRLHTCFAKARSCSSAGALRIVNTGSSETGGWAILIPKGPLTSTISGKPLNKEQD